VLERFPALEARRQRAEAIAGASGLSAFVHWQEQMKDTLCPLWVKSGHVDRRAECQLSANSGHNLFLQGAGETTALG
jgi:hypothetical protein